MTNNVPICHPAISEDESQRATLETAIQGHEKDVFSGFSDLVFRQLPKLSDLPKPDLIKTPAVILGMTGAVFVALPATIFRLAGFSCWIVANFLQLWQNSGH